MDRDTLIWAIENGCFQMPPIPGKIEIMDIGGVHVCSTNVSHPYTNIAGLSRMTSADADETIAQVRDLFLKQNKDFGWMVGPTSTPSDILERLKAVGMDVTVELDGMVLHDLDRYIPETEGVTIREAGEADSEKAEKLIARAYPLPEDVCHLYSAAYITRREEIGTRTYFAFVPDNESPVAISFLTFFPGKPIAQLSGAATLPEYRGKGIYGTMVARRLRDARAADMEKIIIQAVRDSSAPICRKMGFETVCALSMCISTPEMRGK